MFRATIFIALFVGAAIAEELYSDKYDYVDVDQILATPRLRESYYRCFAGTAPCISADAKFFKDKFPEAIITKCKKCTTKQMEAFDKITDWYTTHEPEKYQTIVAKALAKYSKKSTK